MSMCGIWPSLGIFISLLNIPIEFLFIVLVRMVHRPNARLSMDGKKGKSGFFHCEIMAIAFPPINFTFTCMYLGSNLSWANPQKSPISEELAKLKISHIRWTCSWKTPVGELYYCKHMSNLLKNSVLNNFVNFINK